LFLLKELLFNLLTIQNYTEETPYEKEVTILATTNSPFMLNKEKLTLI